MMLNDLDQFFLDKDEPNKSCFMALRQTILDFSPQLSEHWKYKLPFYYFKGRPFCYLWQDKKTTQPYIGIVKGKYINSPILIQGDRKKMKVFMIDPDENLPVKDIYAVFIEATKYYP